MAKTAKAAVTATKQPVQAVEMVDPSLQYIEHPLQAPLITDAKRYVNLVHHRNILIYLKDKHGWRSHVKMAVRAVYSGPIGPAGKKGSEVKHMATTIGLFRPGSHDVIPCTSPAHHPAINSALSIITQTCTEQRVHGYIEGEEYDSRLSAAKHSYLKYLVMSVERATNKIQLTIVWAAPKEDAYAGRLLAKFVAALTQHEQSAFQAIWVNHHVTSKHDNSITGRERSNWVLLYGSEYLLEDLHVYRGDSPYAGMRLHFLPFVFRQANIDAFTGIIEKIRSLLPTGLTCLELYGGIGTIGLHLLDHLHTLHCSDENPFNQICFEKSVALLSIGDEKAKYFPLSAEQMVAREDVQRNLTELTDDFYSLIVVDPPRKGLDQTVVQALIAAPSAKHGSKKRRFNSSAEGKESRVQRFIYVSCGFEALKKDLAALTNCSQQDVDKYLALTGKRPRTEGEEGFGGGGGWKVVQVFGFVLFPGADHLETLVMMEREIV